MHPPKDILENQKEGKIDIGIDKQLQYIHNQQWAMP
jgi:hypothetical protein